MEIKRSIFNKLYSEMMEPEVSILLGARQVGKTTLLKRLESEARSNGLSTVYFDLESSTDLSKLSGDNKSVIAAITGSAKVVFIDEFHYLKNASKIFKEIYDSKKGTKIYASGSSSLEVHRHLKESLAGRFRRTMIFPLSLAELGAVPGNDIATFLKWGGMPGLLHRISDDDKMDLLENIVSTYITKDIKGLIKEENVRAFNAMLYNLAQNQGSLTVAAGISKEVGLAESTVLNYLEIMAHTYVCHIVSSYSNNLANELKKSKKCYLFDIGIRNGILKDFRSVHDREDKGAIYESFVLQHLASQLKPNMELKFWRTKKGAEVDFILLVNRQPVPIEVKSRLQCAEVPSGMRSFMEAYPKAKSGVVFNEGIDEVVNIKGNKIHFMPFERVCELNGIFAG